jgi:hypothetical protein
MRGLIIAAFLSASALAQTPAEALKKLAQKMEALAARTRKPAENARSVPAPGQPCAIPLLNVLHSIPPPVPMPRVPAPPGKFHIREVVPPAPSCDDVKR